MDDRAARRGGWQTEPAVDDLLSRMTVPEKAGQLTGTYLGHMAVPKDADDVEREITEHGVGSLAAFGWSGAGRTTPGEIVETVNECQRIAVEETRLGIPLLCCVDAVHGHAYVAGATVFPNGLGAAATWDPDLVERGARVCAREIRATGAHQNYSPTCDVGRSARWGRVLETFGESPHLVGEMAAAKIQGYQYPDAEGEPPVLATAKHFPAYSEPERGEDASPTEVSRYRLQNTFLPPFRRAIDAGAAAVMPAYNSTNGEAIHASQHFLTDVLRGDLGFDGHVLSDWEGIRQIHEDHRVAADRREAVHRARTAGVDLASVGTADHAALIVDLVESGDLPEETLDRQVRRILRAKVDLGLFEDPYVDREAALDTVGRESHREVAGEAARSSMTLLRNEDDVLPLADDADVLVAGPNADDLSHQVGGWSLDDAEQLAGTTIREGLSARGEGDVTYEPGATLNETLDVDAAAEAAREADVAVLALGEGWYLHEFGPVEESGVPTGDWPTRAELTLPEAQRDLVRAVRETGTPVVATLVAGRPLAVEWLAERVPSLLMAYFPGSAGGTAVAETLYGDAEPTGRLPISMPRREGDLPQHHDYHAHPRPIGDDEHPPSYDPLFRFGHGLSYTTIETTSVDVDGGTVAPGDEITVEATLSNEGARSGREVVQVYASQRSPRRVRPVEELVGFGSATLDPGEERTVAVTVPTTRLGYRDPDGSLVLEPDEYTLRVGERSETVEVAGTYL